MCTIEANAATKELAFGVTSIIVPSNFPQTDNMSHLEIKTLENEELLVEVTCKGFRITNQEERDVKYYETPYALLSDISEGFRQKFSDSLTAKLLNLDRE